MLIRERGASLRTGTYIHLYSTLTDSVLTTYFAIAEWVVWWHPTENSALYMQLFLVSARNLHVQQNIAKISDQCNGTHEWRNFCVIWKKITSHCCVFFTLNYDTTWSNRWPLFPNISELQQVILVIAFLRIANNNDVHLFNNLCVYGSCLLAVVIGMNNFSCPLLS
jgi:hypothetical protein